MNGDSAQAWRLPADLLRQLAGQAIAGYPEEVCGLLFGPKGEDRVTRAAPMTNIANRLHQADPVRYPRTAATFFQFDDREHLRVQKEMRAEGLEEKVIYHSHVDCGAYFSAEDKANAAPDGEPWYPEAGHLVISVRNRVVDEARIFFWDAASRDFTGRPVPVDELNGTGAA
ncbi:MAG: hypothetical protein GMKNLPBB_03408 [Myxococcota bacterium]|nr:hypothetical protein [Myxococcota bacterium]